MNSLPSDAKLLRFGTFELDRKSGELRKAGIKQQLTGQPFKFLQALLEHPGEVVTREELRDRLWPDHTAVDYDLALRKAVNRVREVLGDTAESPRFVETIPRRGYRLLAEVQAVEAARASPTGRQTRWKLAISVALGVAAGLLLILNAARLRTRIFANWRPSSIRSIAVLPLQNFSGDPSQEYFSDGMTDALITDLAHIDSIKVISRTSSMQYKQTRMSLPEIARELKVDGIVEGTIQRSGDRVRITAQLIDASNDRHLWAKMYEADLRDILTVENDVARSIANEIEVQLTSEQRARLASAAPINREAYELYLKGRYFWSKRNPDALKKALDYFQQAAEKAPAYAPAEAGIADAYSLLAAAGYDVLPRADAMEKARAAASKALKIDDSLAEAHASLGYVIYSYDWDWAAAEKELNRAVALNPNYPTAHEWYSEYLNDLGRKEEALAQAQAALMLDPISVVANNYVARAYYFARRTDQAIETSKKILELDPNFAVAHLRLGRAYAAKGMYSEAIKEFQEFARLSGDIPLTTASVGNALARSGDQSGAIHTLHELAMLSKQKHVPAICFALVYIGLGDKNEAFAFLEKAYKERSDFLLVLKVDPLFDPLRSEPRFRDLLRRMGLPQ